MKKLYAVYSGRGIYNEIVPGETRCTGKKEVSLTSLERAKERAKKVTAIQRRSYWVNEVELRIVKDGSRKEL